MSIKLKAILLSLLATLAMNSIASPSGNMVWDSDKPTTHMVKVKNIYTDKELISLFKKYDYYAVNLIYKNIIHIVLNNQNYVFHNDSQYNNRFYIMRHFENVLKLGLDTT